MKYIYAVASEEELSRFKDFKNRHYRQIQDFISYLSESFEVSDFPKLLLLTSEETATNLLSELPIPAYTNGERIVFTPDLEVWRKIYLKQLDNLTDDSADNKLVEEIKTYYQTQLNERHLLQIIGHELAHQSENFIEEYELATWFEEGVVEYISRKYFLTEDEFELELENNQKLVDLYSDKYGKHSLEAFGAQTYQGDYASIFFEYWRSLLQLTTIIKAFEGDIHAVFSYYHKWDKKSMSLTEWFASHPKLASEYLARDVE